MREHTVAPSTAAAREPAQLYIMYCRHSPSDAGTLRQWLPCRPLLTDRAMEACCHYTSELYAGLNWLLTSWAKLHSRQETELHQHSPSDAGTLSRANTVAALPSSAALPIHHLMAPSSGVLITHCVCSHRICKWVSGSTILECECV